MTYLQRTFAKKENAEGQMNTKTLSGWTTPRNRLPVSTVCQQQADGLKERAMRSSSVSQLAQKQPQTLASWRNAALDAWLVRARPLLRPRRGCRSALLSAMEARSGS